MPSLNAEPDPHLISVNTGFLTQTSKEFVESDHSIIVNHKNFAVGRREVLRQNAANRFFDEALVVVRVDQYA